MIKKITMLVLLACFALVATDAMSQSPGSPGPATPAASSTATEKDKVAVPGATTGKEALPSATQDLLKGTAPTAKDVTSAPAVKESVAKDAKDASPGKSVPPSSAPPAAKDAGKDFSSSKSPPTGKDASSSPTSKTSPASLPASSPTRTSVTVERALVTLIDDNKVPASEPGMLMKVLVKEGHFVSKDDQVAEIDTRSTLAKMEIARSEHLASLAQSENEAEVEVAEAAIKVAQAELDQDIEIQKSTPQAVSKSQIRKDQFNLDKSKAQLKQAINEKKIAGLTANAKLAQFDAAKIELDLRQVRAPFDGVVVEITKNPGDWVNVGEPMMHIVGLDKVRVKGFVPASGPDGASPNDVYGKDVQITVETAAGKKHTVKGIIGFASPVIEGVGTSRQFRVWAEVENEKTTDPVTKQTTWRLQPGSVATMTIDLTPPRPQPATKTQTFKPVTEGDKAGTKKSKSREF